MRKRCTHQQQQTQEIHESNLNNDDVDVLPHGIMPVDNVLVLRLLMLLLLLEMAENFDHDSREMSVSVLETVDADILFVTFDISE